MTALTPDTIRKMKVSELRAALARRGLASAGLKADLITRLQGAVDEEEFGFGGDGADDGTGDGGASTEVANGSPPVAPASGGVPGEDGEIALAAPPPPATAPAPSPSQTPPADDNAARLAARAARFGVISEAARAGEEARKKTARAARFGIVDEEAEAERIATEEAEKVAARAARFGLPLPFDVQRKRRAARFGIPVVGADEGKAERQRGGRQADRGDGLGKALRGGRKRTAPGHGNEDGAVRESNDKSGAGAGGETLSREEVERRLARAAKFGTGGAPADALRAQLRAHRFATEGS
mmetsp:Transcript_23829/g.47360  ORF Transcript_23829/g.47360 Transcript_23829/m.47360 type:complete len:297 (-) Transcript_23829:235-1125(-)